MIALRNSLIGALLLLGSALSASVASATDYYVSTRGDDSRAGTSPSEAWRTIAKANAKVQPGDTVHLGGGLYYDDPIRPGTSGTAADKITYVASVGETPILTSKTVGGLKIAINLNGRSYIRVEKLFVDGVQPNPDARVDHFASILNGHYNQLVGCTFRFATGWYGIRLDDSHHNRIVDSVIDTVGIYDNGTGDDWGDGIQILGDSHHNLIDGNTLTRGAHNLLQVEGEFNVVRNNVFDNDWTSMMGVGKGGRNLSLMGYRNLFEYNVVRNAKASSDKPANAGMKVEGRSNIVRRNLMLENSNEGITSQTRSGQKYAEDNHIFHNTIVANGGPGWGLVYYDGGYAVRGNVFKNNIVWSNRRTSSLTAADIVFKLATNPAGVVGETYIERNLIAAVAPNDAAVEIKGGGGLMSLSDAEGKFSQFFVGNIQEPPTFASDSFSSLDDTALASGSRGIDEGAPLTRTASGGSGTTIAVLDAGYFTNGFGLIPGDRIQIGDGAPLLVARVDYSARTIKVMKSTSWDEAAPVYLEYSGRAPDIGAREWASTKPKGRQPKSPSKLSGS